MLVKWAAGANEFIKSLTHNHCQSTETDDLIKTNTKTDLFLLFLHMYIYMHTYIHVLGGRRLQWWPGIGYETAKSWGAILMGRYTEQSRTSHYKDKTVSQPSYLYNGNPLTWTDQSSYWNLSLSCVTPLLYIVVLSYRCSVQGPVRFDLYIIINYYPASSHHNLIHLQNTVWLMHW